MRVLEEATDSNPACAARCTKLGRCDADKLTTLGVTCEHACLESFRDSLKICQHADVVTNT